MITATPPQKREEEMSGKNGLLLISALLASFTLVACGNDSSAPQATDYSQAAHWLSLPAVTEPVDVFYLYPTAWENSNPDPQISAIDDPSMLILATLAFERQATAFETAGNVFAPYYRQDNNSPVDRLNVIAGIPTLMQLRPSTTILSTSTTADHLFLSDIRREQRY